MSELDEEKLLAGSVTLKRTTSKKIKTGPTDLPNRLNLLTNLEYLYLDRTGKNTTG